MKKLIDWFRSNFSCGENPIEIVEEYEPQIQSSVIPKERKDDFCEVAVEEDVEDFCALKTKDILIECEDDEKKKKKKEGEEDEDDLNKTEEVEKIEKGDDDENYDIEIPKESEPLGSASNGKLMDKIAQETIEKGINVLKLVDENDEGYLRAVKRSEQNLISKYTPNVWRDKNGRYISRKK